MRRALAGLVVVGLAACSLTTDFDGFTGGAPQVDGGGVRDSSILGPEAGVPEATTLAPPPSDAGDAGIVGSGVVIAKGVAPYGAGGAQKHHVHYARNHGMWTIFYETTEDRDHLFVKATTDFVTFTDGPALALPRPHDNDGRNFDVTYQALGTSDVFYVAYSTHDTNRYSYVARACGQNSGTITWGTPISIGEADAQFPDSDPDAPAIAFVPGERVIVSSGFNSVNGHYFNFDAFAAQQDDGSTNFLPKFDAGTELEVAAHSVNARTIVSTASFTVAAWERGDMEPNPTDLALAGYANSAWTSVSSAQLGLTSYDPNDWDIAPSADNGRVHAVRWSTGGGFEHKYYDPTVGAHSGYAIPSTPFASGEGLVTLGLAGGVTALSLTQTDHVLRQSQLIGTTWSAWTDLVAADPKRHHISGGARSDGAGVVLWEIVNADGTHDLAGLKLQ